MRPTNKLVDKLSLFLFCSLILLQGAHDSFVVVTMLTAVILSCAATLLPQRFAPVPLLGFIALCLWDAAFLPFTPLLVYDALSLKERRFAALFLLPLVYHYDPAQKLLTGMPLGLSLIVVSLSRRTASYESAAAALHDLADQKRENDMRFASQSKELLEKQDYEVHLAILSERNRIARDIHDNVGHMLSRALLQTGALLYAPGLTQEASHGLTELKDTLSSAMNSVRQSVHDLHAQSIDLHAQLKALADAFTLCPVDLVFDVEDMNDAACKYSFLAIVKEALSNTAKHANAPSRVSICVREHPALYQLDIRDDGRAPGPVAQTGLGLRSIEERVLALGGSVHFEREQGFRVFVSIPKETARESLL